MTPGRLQTFYAYAVIDLSTSPPTPVAMQLSRKEARFWVQSLGTFAGPQRYRVRRVKVLLYES